MKTIKDINAEELKIIVKNKYGTIAKQGNAKGESSSCCSTDCCEKDDYTLFSDNYSDQEGYNPDADFGLGCGIPTRFAGIEIGHHILDLGSGAGIDSFIARQQVGETGSVTGIDFTEAMIEKAMENLAKTDFKNINFILGDIEEMPVPDNRFDVVISNCVLNLVPDKSKAFTEIYRVLKPGGHFCVSDIVLNGVLHEKLIKSAELYTSCVSGAMQRNSYMALINENGFTKTEIMQQTEVNLPDEILNQHLTSQEILLLKANNTGIIRIIIKAFKPQ